MVALDNYNRRPLQLLLMFSVLSILGAREYRNRRDAVSYVIDTLVVVDQVVFNKWVSFEPVSRSLQQRQVIATSKLKTYVSLVIHQVNDRLMTLDNQGQGWSVQMSISRIILNVNLLGAAVRETNTNHIDPEVALSTLSNWAAQQGHSSAFDHVVLLTGESFALPSQTEVRGRAYVGTMCNTKGYSVSFVKEIGGFQSTGYVAHEVAHSLGSAHDGEGNSSDCSGDDRYIMAVNLEGGQTTSNKENPWYFSACTSRSIRSFLATPQATCLTTHQEPASEFTESKDLVPGLQYDGNQQCRNIYDSTSSLCLGDSYSKLSDICTSMYCLDPSQSQSGQTSCNEYIFAAEGTPCGNGKLCTRGKCVNDSRAPLLAVDSTCPYGDSVTPINGMRCSQYIDTHPSRCYDDNIRSSCCASCERFKTEFEVCRYGDRKRGCLEQFCNSIRADGTIYDEDCCGTCSYNAPLDCVDVSPDERMSCAQYIVSGGVQRCYDPSVAFQCCQNCASQRTTTDGCEYGDRFVGDYCQSFVYRGGNCSEEGHGCCQTCDDYLNSSPSIVYFNCCHLLSSAVIFWLVYYASFSESLLSLLSV